MIIKSLTQNELLRKRKQKCAICGADLPKLPLVYKQRCGKRINYTFCHLSCYLLNKGNFIVTGFTNVIEPEELLSL